MVPQLDCPARQPSSLSMLSPFSPLMYMRGAVTEGPVPLFPDTKSPCRLVSITLIAIRPNTPVQTYDLWRHLHDTVHLTQYYHYNPNKIWVQMVHNLDNRPTARQGKQASKHELGTYESMPLTTRAEFWRLPLPVWGGERARGCQSGETRKLCTVPGCGSEDEQRSGNVQKGGAMCLKKSSGPNAAGGQCRSSPGMSMHPRRCRRRVRCSRWA